MSGLDDMKAAIAGRIPELVASHLPQAKRAGATFRLGDVTGTAGNSLAIDGESGVWMDHATGAGGDFFDLLMRSKGWTFPQAKEAVCGAVWTPSRSSKKAVQYNPPSVSAGNYTDVLQLQKIRRYPMTAGIELAIQRGWLGFGEYRGKPAWCALGNGCCQWRRLDGAAWWPDGPKALSGPGSGCANGIGTKDAMSRDRVWLAEGPPDAIAALTILFMIGEHEMTGTIALLGSSAALGDPVMNACAGKPVTIISDPDNAGQKAAQRWAGQLHKAGSKVGIWQSGSGQDLNAWLADFDRSHGWDPVASTELLKREFQCL